MAIVDIFKKLQNYSDVMNFNEALTVSEIQEFQEDNGIELPKSLVQLYTCFDGGEIFVPGTVIYGLKNGKKVLREANGKANRGNLNIPMTQLIIAKFNFGDYITIDLNGNNSITQWSHETGEEEMTWSDLEQFLNESIEDYEA